MYEHCEERVCNIEDPAEAVTVRLRLMQRAQKNIRMAVFEFHDDATGRLIMAALAEAACRGVKVELIVDGFSSSYGLFRSQAFQALSRHGLVEIRVYNPIGFGCAHPNCRMHDKYLIIDDSDLLLGGRNIGNAFMGHPRGRIKRDRDLLVHETFPGQGQAYRELSAYFTSVWESPYVRKWKAGAVPYSSEQQEMEHLREIYETGCREYGTADEGRLYAVDSISLAVNPINASRKTPVLFETILKDMAVCTGQGTAKPMADDTGQAEAKDVTRAAARASLSDVIIQTPYIIMDQEMRDEYQRLLPDVSGITVITNAPERGSNYFGSADLMRRREEILARGVRLCEYSHRDAVLHGKMFLIGDSISYIGSFNLDSRSCRLDMEADFRVVGREFHDHMAEVAEELQESCRISGKCLPTTFGTKYWKQPMSRAKQVGYTVLNALDRPFRRLM